MLRSSLCAFLAPAMVSAMAFPWAGPEPTLVMPEGDNWSPVPTKGPEIGLLELFKRAAGDNTCGYVNGISTSSLTCNDNAFVCATNTYYGVHGCCDPNSLAQCSIPTTCIASTDLAASCTDVACSSNNYIAKCTDSDMPYCYQWRYVYSTRTVMTEYGCADSAFTVSVQRTFSDYGSAIDTFTSSDPVIPISTQVVTFTPSSSSETPSSTIDQSATATGTIASIATGGNHSLPTTKKKSKTSVGPIVGGVVGGLVVIGAIIFGVIFALLRKKKNQKAAAATATTPNMAQGPAPGVAEFKPQPGGFPPQQGYQPPPQQGGYYQQDVKPGFTQQAHMGVPGQEVGGMSQPPYSPPMSPAPQYSAPLNQGPPPGIAEAHGNSIQPAQQPHPQQHQVYEAP